MSILASDPRDQFIAEVVSDQTFADVGGLWGVVNEKVSVAWRHRARDLTMIDVTLDSPDPGGLWGKFRARMAELNIERYTCLSQDICDPSLAQQTSFDVVHCSGVFYHHPHPLLMLEALRAITRRYLILTSSILPEVIENEYGRYQLPSSGVLFIPALGDSEFKIVKTFWERAGVQANGLTERANYRLRDFGPWWWLPTASALTAMCEVIGFKAIKSQLTWRDKALVLLLSV